MTRAFHSLSRTALAAFVAAAAFGAPAMSQSNEQALIEALRAKPTRGVQPARTEAELAADAQAQKVIESLKSKALRGLSASVEERQQVAAITETKSAQSVDVEVMFKFNSAELMPGAEAELDKIGRALKDGQLAAADMLVAGHTDAKGTDPYNLKLSQRRAEVVRDYLIKKHGVTAEKLIPVGFGREKLKEPAHPFADKNRRVQVVNLSK